MNDSSPPQSLAPVAKAQQQPARLPRALLVHNYYQQPGGEDLCHAAERSLLQSHGHRVHEYTVHNDAIMGMSRLALLRATLWNEATRRRVRDLVHENHVTLAHFQNTFPLISPAAYYGARVAGAAVVQSLHNYRLICPGAYLLRDGAICERCLSQPVPISGLTHGCYHGSRAHSTVVALMLSLHRLLGTWHRQVDMYIALTEFGRSVFIRGGLPEAKIAVKPNFVHPDPGAGDGTGGYALFVGRLSAEKGLSTLLDAWRLLQGRIELQIIGDGPLAPLVNQAAREDEHICWLGTKPSTAVLEAMRRASVLIFPSVWYEGFPRVLAEAYAVGTPVVASDLGAMREIVDHGRTGLRCTPGDAEDLAARVEHLFSRPEELVAMRREARAEYLAKYTAERNYQILMEIYRRAIRNRNQER